jgi:DNA mismatch repair protein MutS2
MTDVTGIPSSSAPAMDAGTASQLEFAQALELVSRLAVSEAGAERVCQRLPATSVDEVREELAAVAELADLIDRGDGFSPQAVPDVRPILERLRVPGSVLEGAQLSELGQAAEAIRTMATDLRRLQKDSPRVYALAVDPPPSALARRLTAAIEVDGSVTDNASDDLKRARRNLRATRDRLVELLQGLIERFSSAISGVDAGVTMRGGRYVIPVRREARSRVKGIVHGESGSGATLFIEPQDAVAPGNELSACEATERRVVLQVLRDLTEFVRPEADRIADGWNMCVRVDDLYARARYALNVEGCLPAVVEAPSPMVIRNGRHPLLLAELDLVVPFDLETNEKERVIVVSGPNTGGKTVLLKAVGLINALAQSGVIPPVGEGTTLPVFGMIFADIGDHQSISENLSTFSGHVAALKAVLESADDNSLVLLDEFGTGTDPSEGAALAGAVLQTLCDRGCVTLATTHLHQLKRLASETEGAVNASLQFDAEHLEPTYRVVKGIPGRSYGLAIAQRLGFPPHVMTLARELQPDTERSLESLLADVEKRDKLLRAKEGEIAEAEARLQAERDGLDQLHSDLASQAAEIDRQAREMELHGREEARRFLLEARKRVEDALGLARAAVTEATAKEARRLLEEGARNERSALKRLEEEARKKGWRVQGPGSKTFSPQQGPTVRPGVKRRTPSSLQVSKRAARWEIDLRGMTADEAEEAVKHALDEAIVADLGSVRIIHGKGTGVLRERVSAILSRDGRVASFHTSPPHQGGWGVTIAEFKW